MRKQLFKLPTFILAIGILSSAIIVLAHGNSNEKETVPISTEQNFSTEVQIEVIIETQTQTMEQITEVEEVTSIQSTDFPYSKNFNDEDYYMLAKIAMAEAEGEPTEGKALVVLVVLNRVMSDEFPNTIEDVLFERTNNGGWQFSPMQDGGRWYTTEPNEDCYKAIEMVMTGWDESCGALYFESSDDPTWHSTHLEFLFKVGRHKFYR